MSTAMRPTLRGAFLTGEKRLQVFFYTSNDDKFSHAATVFDRSGLRLRHFRSKTDPYNEDYSAGKEKLLTRAIAQILREVGRQALFFVEDTSLRIEALSQGLEDYPGLAVKEWFLGTSFAPVDASLTKLNKGRHAIVKSDIALHIPELSRPIFFQGQTHGVIADSAPQFVLNSRYPWLTPYTFNGWLIPEGATKRLGEMSLEESWQYDFRTQSLEKMLCRLEEYAAVLNLPSHSYSKPLRLFPKKEELLFPVDSPIFLAVGKTCAGKSTFGERAQGNGLHWIEASSVLRTLRNEYEDEPTDAYEFAKDMMNRKGADVVAMQVLQLYGEQLLEGAVITGFRTIEEMETIKSRFPNAQVVLIEASERTRLDRSRARARAGEVHQRAEFRAADVKQWSFGLLRVAEEFADIRISNEGTMDDFLGQIDYVLREDIRKPIAGVSRRIHPKFGMTENQLYKCLSALDQAGRALTCSEIQELTARDGMEVLHNNANKVLKKVPELARRYELKGARLRYEITSAGRAYARYMRNMCK